MKIDDTTTAEQPVQTLDQEDNFDWCEKAVWELAQSKGITTEECERRLREWIDILDALAWRDILRRQEESGSDDADFLPWEGE